MRRYRGTNHGTRNHSRTWLLGALVVGSLMAVRAAHAQEVFGTLREELTQRPVAGALITVSLAANDSTLVRTTTNERGLFRVVVGVAPVVVRALRIGQQPVELARLMLSAGEERDVSGALPDRPIQLLAINTRVDNRCRNDPVNGSRVAQLFNEARTALLSSRVAAQSRPARSVFRQVVQQYSVQERAVGDPLVREDTIASLQPFRANDVTQLLASGFREIRADNSIIYSAPDAELLTDDRFLEAYCLRLADEPADDPTMVGVTFEPARRRGSGFVQLRGTLWLDERTQELRRIDYGYRGLEPALTRTEPGGVVEYTRLDNGVWFVSDWSIRLPRVARVVTRGPGGRELDYATVNGLQVTNGHVVSIEDAGQLLFTAGDDRGAQSLEELTASLVALRDSTHCETVREDTLATLTGTLRDSSGAPRAGAVVRARWTETRRLGDVGAQNTRYVEHERQLLAFTDADGNFEICDLPRRVKIELLAGDANDPIARTSLRLRRTVASAYVRLVARSIAMQGDAEDRLAGRDDDSLMTAGSASDSVAAHREAVDTLVASSLAGTVPTVDSTPARAGRSLRIVHPSGIPVAYAQVWIDGRPPVTADSLGRVPVLLDPEQRTRVAVRRIGYRGLDTAITVLNDAPTDLALHPVNPELEAVRITAARLRVLERTGFYDRMERVRKGAIRGEFVTPEELESRNIVVLAQIFAGRSLVSVSGTSVRDLKLSGRGGCPIQVLVDGAITDRPFEILDVHSIMAVEIYASTANAPMELIPTTRNGSCGIVAIWTGPRR